MTRKKIDVTDRRARGRPRIIESPEEMDRLVDEYVSRCRELEESLTLTGMILHMGLSSRQSFDRYREREGFRDSVRRAKLLIEEEYEKKLDRPRCAGPIFALKNMGWSDRRELEVSGGLAKIDPTKLPDALLDRIIAGEHPMSVLASATEEIKRLALPPESE